MTISISEFWAAIESINQSALDREEENLALQPLIQALELFSFAEIEGFEQYLAKTFSMHLEKPAVIFFCIIDAMWLQKGFNSIMLFSSNPL
jgi:hypothetical protein